MKDWKSDLKVIKKALSGGNGNPGVSAERRDQGLVSPTSGQGKGSRKLPAIDSDRIGKQFSRASPKSTVGEAKQQAFRKPASNDVPRPVASAPKLEHPAIGAGNVPGKHAGTMKAGMFPVQSNRVMPGVKLAAAPVPVVIRALRRLAPARQKLFKLPDDWVGAGSSTQLAEKDKSSRALDIVIGIDFGTSYTKAAVGMLDKIFPVDWSGVSSASPTWLLPSEYSQMSDGQVNLGQRPDATEDQVKLDLKLPFIDAHVSNASIARAAVFLAAVLRYVRAWVFKVHGTKIGSAGIRWQLNLGSPSNGLESERVVGAYKRLGLAAWLLSQRRIDSSMADAVQVVSSLSPSSKVTDLHDDAVSVFPEFVAQMAGYVQSPERQRGLHALADVGGGTLDVVTFIVHQVDHEDTFPFLVPEVHSLGTHLLNQNRIVGAPGSAEELMPDALMPVLDSADFALATGLSPSQVQARDQLFSAKVESVVKKVFLATKASRYRLSEAWTTELRTFLTGGGAEASGYRGAVERGGLSSARSIQLLPLPIHPKLAEFSGTSADYQRISVACGLAQDSFSLGRIIPAKDVEDDRAIRTQVRLRPDRDELYAK